MIKKKNLNSETIFIIFLSFLFVLTVQIFDIYKGNAAHLIHSIKFFDSNKLQNDWIANQEHHLPLFTYFNYFLIKIFSKNVIFFIHSFLLALCPLSLFLISKELFPKLCNRNLSILWFSLFTILYHENSFFSGVAGQTVIDAGYQPASFAVLFFLGIHFFLIKKNMISIIFICLSASFHPTYVLHSGFLIISILGYQLWTKKYLNFFKETIFYIILIFPITIFIIINFFLIDKNLILVGQEILLNRIPHHANIHHWLTYKDFIFLFIYFFSLYLIRKNYRFFIFFLFFGLFPTFITIIQYYINSNSIALAFPWRTSVFIMPISSLIILSFFLNKIDLGNSKLKILSYCLIAIVSTVFFVKSHYIKNSNLEFQNKLILVKEIRKNFNSIDRILIPIDLDYIRMNTGLPIFVDWKHHAFRYDQLIEWKLRIDLAKDFFESNTLQGQLVKLKKIQEIEQISHILIKKDKSTIECNDLVNHNVYMLININDCFDNKI